MLINLNSLKNNIDTKFCSKFEYILNISRRNVIYVQLYIICRMIPKYLVKISSKQHVPKQKHRIKYNIAINSLLKNASVLLICTRIHMKFNIKEYTLIRPVTRSIRLTTLRIIHSLFYCFLHKICCHFLTRVMMSYEFS